MPEAVSFLQIKIIQISLLLSKSLNHMICQLDMVLCKEKLENKEPRQKQVLGYEGSSGTAGHKEAWKLHVLVASGAFPSLQLTHSTDTRLLAFERRQHFGSEKQGLLVALPRASVSHVCKNPQQVRKSVAHS